jgi:hypothetical protein
MILTTQFEKACPATIVDTGVTCDIPAGLVGPFIVRHHAPVMFYYRGQLCLTSRDAFCGATGSTQEQLENLDPSDSSDDEDTVPILDDVVQSRGPQDA